MWRFLIYLCVLNSPLQSGCRQDRFRMWSGVVLKLVGGMDDVIYHSHLLCGSLWHTLARRILYFKAECHENEQTRYLYITRNPRYFKRLTFSQSQIWKKNKDFTLIHLEGKKGIQKPEVALVRKTVSQRDYIFRFKKYKDSILSNATTEFTFKCMDIKTNPSTT